MPVFSTPYIVTPEMFGAVKNGTDNDTLAIQRMVAAVVSRGSGIIVFDKGTYLIGKQSLSGSFGQGGSYIGEPIMNFTGCDSITIIGRGATLKYIDGYRYGSFDPVTGLSYNPGSLPFYDTDYRATMAEGVIRCQGCSYIDISGIEIDGNIENAVIGGEWGDTGRQLNCSGIYVQDNKRVSLRDAYIHHLGLDGLLVVAPSVTTASIGVDDFPVSISRVRSHYNGRQGLSWVGGIGLSAEDCDFSNTGQSTVYSAPGAGVDIEAEGGSQIRRGLFKNCTAVNNKGAQFLTVGDTGDVVLDNCTLWTTATSGRYALWCDDPGYTFRNCRVYGQCVYASPAGNYVGCEFDDKPHPSLGSYPAIPTDYTFNFSGGVDAHFNSCTFRSRFARLLYVDGSATNLRTVLSHCTLTSACDLLADKEAQVYLKDVELSDCEIQGDYTTPPANAYIVDIGGQNVVIGQNVNVKLASYLRATSWTPDFGIVGPWATTHYISSTNDRDRLLKEASRGLCMVAHPTAYGVEGSSDLANTVIWRDTIPTSGTWKVGDICVNTTPTTTGILAWVCTTAGTPGNWQTSGFITLTGSAVIDLSSIPAGGIETATITVDGAVSGDNSVATPQAAIENGLIWCAYVSAANTVTIRVLNATSGAVDPAPIIWRAKVFKSL